MRPGVGRVHPESLRSLGCAFGVTVFTRRRWGDWGAPSGSSGSFRVGRFIRVRHRGRFIRSRFFPGVSLGSSGSFWVVDFVRVRLEARRVHPRSLGPLRCALGIVGFIRGR